MGDVRVDDEGLGDQDKRQEKSGLIWVLSILGGVALFVLVVVAVAYYSGWLSNLLLMTRPPEYSASYYPDDTLLYAWFTLNPGDGQREQMQNIWEGLNEHSVFRDWTEDIEDSFRDEFDADIEDDLLVWMGPEISFAIRDVDVEGGKTEGAITIDVRDSDAAEDFLLDFIEYQIEENGADFDRSSKGNFDVWGNKSEFYALSDQLLIYTTDERVLSAIIKRVDGEEDKSLSRAGQRWTTAVSKLSDYVRLSAKEKCHPL